MRSRRWRWRSGAGSGGRRPPAPGDEGSAEPRRPRRRQPLSIGRPGRAARVNYAGPGQRRGVTAAAGCGRRARPQPRHGPLPLFPPPAPLPAQQPPVTYSVELGGFHSEAKTRRAEKLREAAVHPHSPRSGSKHGKPGPGRGGAAGQPGRGRRSPPDPASGFQAAALHGDAAEPRVVPAAFVILAQTWRRGPHRPSTGSPAAFSSHRLSVRDSGRLFGRTSKVERRRPCHAPRPARFSALRLAYVASHMDVKFI